MFQTWTGTLLPRPTNSQDQLLQNLTRVKDAEAASWYYDFQVQPSDERVFQMKDHKYLVYTNKELVATKICGPNQEHFQISEGTPVEVPGHCLLKFDDHQVYGEESIHHTS